MNQTLSKKGLRRGLDAHIESGAVVVDPNYSTWKSGVFAVVDCVFSAQAKYETMVLPMLQERLSARPGMADTKALTFSHFMADVDLFAPDRWDGYGRAVLTRQVLARRRKVEVCYDIAQYFVERGFETSKDLRKLGDEQLTELVLGPLQSAIRGLGPALSRYLLILLGIEDQIKPDTMILRFFDSLSDWSPRMGEAADIAVIESVIRKAAKAHGTTPARLDNAIWRHESFGI